LSDAKWNEALSVWRLKARLQNFTSYRDTVSLR
jgi:hypothetical protein